jgi:hypothetical protein
MPGQIGRIGSQGAKELSIESSLPADQINTILSLDNLNMTT